eukprot:scaffold17914_cov31-Tisochrysis_lutea.AAC.1
MDALLPRYPTATANPTSTRWWRRLECIRVALDLVRLTHTQLYKDLAVTPLDVVNALLDSLAARYTLHVSIQAVSRLEADRVAVPRADDARAKRGCVFDVCVQEGTPHVVAGGVDGVDAPRVCDQRNVAPLDLDQVATVVLGQLLFRRDCDCTVGHREQRQRRSAQPRPARREGREEERRGGPVSKRKEYS